jgi:hypothetical protein
MPTLIIKALFLVVGRIPKHPLLRKAPIDYTQHNPITNQLDYVLYLEQTVSPLEGLM